MRAILADDELTVRSALRLLLEQESEVQVVGEVKETQELLCLMSTTHPDLLLLDWELAGVLPPTSLLELLHALHPQLKIVALSGRIEARCEALAAGADLFISKSESPERLLEMLNLLACPKNGDPPRVSQKAD
jgi:DNA-binding NarL/FixJ family response regulator